MQYRLEFAEGSRRPAREQVSGVDRAATRRNVVAEPGKKQIEARAYQLWEQAGRPKDRETEFWHLAEQELRNEDKASPIRTPDTL